MPVEIVKRGDKWRVIETATRRLATTAKGTPRDGGGHDSAKAAGAQAGHINRGLKEKERR